MLTAAGVGILPGCGGSQVRAVSANASAPAARSAMKAASVDRPQDFTVTEVDGSIVGGEALRLVDAPADEVVSVLFRPDALWRLLPRVKDFKVLEETAESRLVAVTHAVGPISGGYTMRVAKESVPGGPSTFWFWVDPDRPRDVDSAWGFFRIIPYGADRTLLGYQVRIDLGSGLVRWLFLDRVHKAAMTIPDRALGMVNEHTRAVRAEKPQPDAPTRAK